MTNKNKSDSAIRNLMMTGIVALVAALLVSTAAVLLQPIHQEQQARVRQASMAMLVKKIPTLENILAQSGADSFDSRVVDIDTGCFISDIDAALFDARKAETDPAQSKLLENINGSDPLLKRRSLYEVVHLLYADEELQLLILPIHGPGYQSTLYAWLVLGSDLNTIVALNVYEHADTPGIGSRVENIEWQNSWQNKLVFNEAGQVAINIVKNGSNGLHDVDGISGATRTSMGVVNMLRFWVDEYGFGPLIRLLKLGKNC